MKLININFNKSDKIIFVSIFSISLLLFIFYVSLNAYVSLWDEREYLNISQQILDKGSFDEYASYRTYLYPAIISSVKIFSTDDVTLKIIFSGIQYAVYLGTVILIANFVSSFSKSKSKSTFPNFIDPKKGAQHYLDRYNNEPAYKSWFDKYYPKYTIRHATEIVIPVKILLQLVSSTKNEHKIIWHSMIAFGFLNPFLIQATTLILPDVLLSCFAVLSIFILTRMDLTKSKFIFFAIGLFYCAVMIRPSSMIFLPIVGGIILFRFLKKKNISISKVSLISVILLVIFAPQIYQNVTNFGEWTPLIVKPLYEGQISESVSILKYSTVMIPGEGSASYYMSPFSVDKELNIYQLLLEDPSTFLLVYSSHIFAVLDWNYVDSYISDFYPLNRIPASLLIYSTWFFVIWGILETRFFFNRKDFLMKILLLSTIVYLAFIATTHPEIRYGYPIFLLLLPFSGYGVKYLYNSCIKHDNKTSKLWINRIGFITIYLLFISIFFYISFSFSNLTGSIDWFGFFNL